MNIQITFPGSEKVAEMLIRNGANVMQLANSQVSALHLSGSHGKSDKYLKAKSIRKRT